MLAPGEMSNHAATGAGDIREKMEEDDARIDGENYHYY
jgi:hypothetical protein